MYVMNIILQIGGFGGEKMIDLRETLQRVNKKLAWVSP